VRAAHGLGCARGLQLPLFVALVREVAWLPRVKMPSQPGSLQTPKTFVFFRVVLVAAHAGDFVRRRGGYWGPPIWLPEDG
jgi:hypothetical protein